MASNYSEESAQDSRAIKLRMRKWKNTHCSVPINKQIRLKAPGLRNTSRCLSRRPAESASFTSGVFLCPEAQVGAQGPPRNPPEQGVRQGGRRHRALGQLGPEAIQTGLWE